MNARPFDLIVFDWDGTLMDSAAKICRCLGAAAEDCGIPDPGPDRSRQIIGLGLSEALKALFPGESPADRTRIAERYRYYFLSADQTQTPLFPGVREGLDALRAAGYQLAVATGKSRRGLDCAMAESGTADLFVASRCADESRSKPDPLMLEELLAVTKAPRARAVMVGDTTFDLEMARNAAMAHFAVSYGAHARAQLVALAPLACVDSFDDLCRHLTPRR